MRLVIQRPTGYAYMYGTKYYHILHKFMCGRGKRELLYYLFNIKYLPEEGPLIVKGYHL